VLLLPVQNAGLRKPNKCRLILESFFINVSVVARYFIPKKGFAVSIVHMQINTVRQCRGKDKNCKKNALPKRAFFVAILLFLFQMESDVLIPAHLSRSPTFQLSNLPT